MLERLLDAAEDTVVRVYCQPDRPKGRGKQVAAPPVKVLAEARGLSVAQPTKLKDGAIAQEIAASSADLAVVVAYGRILPKAVFEGPAWGTWNVHASLLPKYRGASPIQHAILNGETQTGVTLMQLTEGLDEGPMLLDRSIDIRSDETAGALTERLAVLGAELLLEGLRLAKSEGLDLTPQDDAAATFAPLIQKGDGRLDLAEPAERLARKIRGFDPWPGTHFETPEGPLKILSGRPAPSDDRAPPGSVLSLEPFRVQTGQGALEIDQLQAPGRRAVKSADFLRGAGRQISIGTQLPWCQPSHAKG